jgi:hypothetical protein
LQTKDLKEVMVNSKFKFYSITHWPSVILACLQFILKECIFLFWIYCRSSTDTRNLILIFFLKLKTVRKHYLSTERHIMERTLLEHMIWIFCLPLHKQPPIHSLQCLGKCLYITCLMLCPIIRWALCIFQLMN